MTNYIGNYDHNTFGGNIYESDFDTSYVGTRNIAGRIISAWKFDSDCRKNIKDKKTKEDTQNA